MSSRTLEITVMPEYAQTEGVEPLLDNIQRAGVTAINTSPYVLEEADEATGGREPPADTDAGKVRLLDRPLFGKRALFVRPAPSFIPDRGLYAGLRYQPTESDELTRREGPVVGELIRAAKRRGLTVHVQVQAAIPPGYRVQFGGPREEDQARGPGGGIVTGRVDKNGSIASPHVRDYGCALLRDLARAYPEADGFRVDWPEYPPYAFEALFLDFGADAIAAAKRLGYDPERMRHDVAAFRRFLLGKLEDEQLDLMAAPEVAAHLAIRALTRHPGLLDWLRLKADLVVELLTAFRAALPADRGLQAQGFPPPWSLVSGFDYGRVAPLSAGIGVKLYTMHWPMMLRGYAEALCAENRRLTPVTLARTLVHLFDTGDSPPARLQALHYPEPDEPHPAGDDAMRRKVRAAKAEAGDHAVYPIIHGYGPIDDFARRATVAWNASDAGVWVNRYGYLSDAKLAVLKQLCRT